MESVAKVCEIYEKFGSSDYIGEEVSQLQHGIQAAMAAESGGFANYVVVAALLHDIGHLIAIDRTEERMGDFGQKMHEGIGSDYLRQLGFDEKVCKLIENHVNAKRYLVAKYPEYMEKLSIASQETLKYQGGPMSQDELISFENEPLFKEYLKIRDFDDYAKIKDMKIKSLSDYTPLMLSVISNPQ